MDKLSQSIKKDYENFFPRFWGPYYDSWNQVARRIALKVLSENTRHSKNLLDVGGGVQFFHGGEGGIRTRGEVLPSQTISNRLP